ncbi:MAG: sensor histidine kinase [Butyricicoccus sp.]
MKARFRFRILIAIVAIAAVCVFAVALISYNESKGEIERNYVSMLDEKLTLQAERFDEIMEELYMEVQSVSCSLELQDCIFEYLDSEQSYSEGVALSESLEDILDFNQMDSTLWLYLPETEQMFSSLRYYPVQNLDDVYLVLWENKTKIPYAPLFYMNQFARSSQYVYAYARSVYDEDGNVLAVVCITVDERQLYYDLLDSMNNTQGENYMILNIDGTISSAERIAQTRKRLEGLKQKQTDRMNAEIGTDGMLYTSVQAPFSHYRLMCRSDLSTLTDSLRRHLVMFVGCLLLILLCTVLVAIFVSDKLYQPVGELVEAIDRVKEGDFTVRVPARRYDEFSAVTSHFNELMSQMDRLMEEVVEEKMQKREAEINALQYQIRPHFMYNTLNSIRFAAMLQGNQKLAGLLDDFIALLEASVQRKGAFVTLSEEIGLVKNYLSLQEFRYFDCFVAEFYIEPEVEDCYVPCLLLQPIIENAVFHGIDPKRNDNKLEIRACKGMDKVILSVRDNGRGFLSEQDEQTEGKRRLTGIGLRNVEQRLQLYYGEQAYFTITSSPGKGTLAEIGVPISYDPEEYSVGKGKNHEKA